MKTIISFLYEKMLYRVKAKISLKYDVDWSKVHTYQQDVEAREKDNAWNIKISKYSIEAWAFFGLLIIELDKYFDLKVQETDAENFKLLKEYQIYFHKKRIPCSTIKKMIEFMRNAYCHPEESATLRLDPYITDKLKMPPEKQNRSYHRVHFLREEETNKYYVQIGGGVLYFDELARAIRIINKKLKTS